MVESPRLSEEAQCCHKKGIRVRERGWKILHHRLWRCRKRPQAKECKPTLGVGKGKKAVFPQSLPKGCNSANTLILDQHDLVWNSDFQNYNIMNLCCFKPLGFLFCYRNNRKLGQGGLACCNSWGLKESGTTERLNWTELSTASRGFPGCTSAKESPCQCRRLKTLIPGSGRSPGGGNGHPFWYSCLENPIDRGPWWVIVLGVVKSWTWLKWLSTHA